MSVRILVDMNLSPEWVDALTAVGRPAVHWSTIGDPRADDRTLMQWARHHDAIVFTNDLDFGTILALSRAPGPSVIQIRGDRVLPEETAGLVLAALQRFEAELHAGAIVVIEHGTPPRVRILPLP